MGDTTGGYVISERPLNASLPRDVRRFPCPSDFSCNKEVINEVESSLSSMPLLMLDAPSCQS